MHTTSIKSRFAVLMAAFVLLGSLTAATPMTGDLPLFGGNVAHAGTNDDSI